jgi:hypothetical protein
MIMFFMYIRLDMCGQLFPSVLSSHHFMRKDAQRDGYETLPSMKFTRIQ